MRGWAAFALACVLTPSLAFGQAGGNETSTTAYNRIICGSTEQPRRSKLRFTGSVSCSDDAANGRTVVNVTGGGGGGGDVVSVHGASTCMVLPTSTTVFMAMGTCADLTESMVEQPFLNAATILGLTCITSHPLGVGNNIQVTARIGACGSLADTALVCAITGGAGRTMCDTGVDTAGIGAGECLSFKVVTPGTLANLPAVNCTFEEAVP